MFLLYQEYTFSVFAVTIFYFLNTLFLSGYGAAILFESLHNTLYCLTGNLST